LDENASTWLVVGIVLGFSAGVVVGWLVANVLGAPQAEMGFSLRRDEKGNIVEILPLPISIKAR